MITFMNKYKTLFIRNPKPNNKLTPAIAVAVALVLLLSACSSEIQDGWEYLDNTVTQSQYLEVTLVGDRTAGINLVTKRNPELRRLVAEVVKEENQPLTSEKAEFPLISKDLGSAGVLEALSNCYYDTRPAVLKNVRQQPGGVVQYRLVHPCWSNNKNLKNSYKARGSWNSGLWIEQDLVAVLGITTQVASEVFEDLLQPETTDRQSAVMAIANTFLEHRNSKTKQYEIVLRDQRNIHTSIKNPVRVDITTTNRAGDVQGWRLAVHTKTHPETGAVSVSKVLSTELKPVWNMVYPSPSSSYHDHEHSHETGHHHHEHEHNLLDHNQSGSEHHHHEHSHDAEYHSHEN